MSTAGSKKQKSKKEKDSEKHLYTTNKDVEVKKISEVSILDQLSRAPSPDNKRKSWYPHKYDDDQNLIYPKGKLKERALERESTDRSDWSASSTRSLREYPVQASGKDYDYEGRKPPDDPGPYRAITNQKKRYKGTIAHDGDGKGNPNTGGFHRLKDAEGKDS